jgi:hypothetical protein
MEANVFTAKIYLSANILSQNEIYRNGFQENILPLCSNYT